MSPILFWIEKPLLYDVAEKGNVSSMIIIFLYYENIDILFSMCDLEQNIANFIKLIT